MSTFSSASTPFQQLAPQVCTSVPERPYLIFSSEQQLGKLGVLRQGVTPPNRRCSLFSSISSSAGSGGSSIQGQSSSYVLTPVGSKSGSRVQRYVWEGHRLKLVSLEALDRGCSSADDLQDVVSRIRHELYHSFFPHEQDVSEDYWPWMQWRVAQRFFSSVMMHYATQSLLVAVGVGAKKAIAASAIINWMLKDGLGRAVRMGVATRYGRSFDSDLKRARFTTSVLLTLCMTGEFLTPLFPQHFLLLASVANGGKAVGLTTHVATLPVFHQALCQGANLGDIAAKTQAQHMLMDMLALVVSTSSAYICTNSPQLRVWVPLLSFPVLGGLDLLCTYKEIKAVQLKTLNRERCEMIAECWVRERRVPSTAEISERERLFWPPESGPLPLEVSPLENMISSLNQLQGLLQRSQGQPYLLELGRDQGSNIGQGVPAWLDACVPQARQRIMACLRSNAESEDIIQLVLHSVLFRQMVLSEAAGSRQHAADSNPSSSSSLLAHHPASSLEAEVVEYLWGRSLEAAQKQLPDYLAALRQAGWQTHPFVRSVEERSGFMAFDD